MKNGKIRLFFAGAAFTLFFAGCAKDTPSAPRQGRAFSLVSGSFTNNSDLPEDLTCDGRNLSPQLRWSDLPAGTKSLALVVRDPDSPSGIFLHWAVVDIHPGIPGLELGAKPPAPARVLKNDAGANAYFGPCPPSGKHRYVFTLYALNSESYVDSQVRLEDYLAPKVLGKAELTGLYQRKQ